MADIIGTPGNDNLPGTNEDDTIKGLGGNDTLDGLDGNDTLEGAQGHDTLRGGGGDDTLRGGVGNDILLGGAGSDTLIGGLGNDTYVLDDMDTIVENAGEGTDTVESSISRILGANLENLVLTGPGDIDGFGNALDNEITGNAFNNEIYGGLGNDTLNGGDGQDWLNGDGGDDTVNGGDGDDLVIGAEGNDTLNGGAGNDSLNAGAGDDTLNGGDGDDFLGGNIGVDTLAGGGGNDTYFLHDADAISEGFNAGIDTVVSSISYTLGTNLEKLGLIGDDWINGTGNDLDNTITGNEGNNILDGSGGSDTLIGGLGNDTYRLDGMDTVVEHAGEGIDTIETTASHALEDHIEHLTLLGTADINGSGNDQNNTITGNSGNNTLAGGSGSDTLRGRQGNDTYWISDPDTVVEYEDEGIDTVVSSFSYSLGANLENLQLIGSFHINGTGNELDNTVTGNSGNNFLRGAEGADTLIGGAGDDSYVLRDVDTIVENAGEGIDTAYLFTSYTLAANIERINMEGTDNIDGTGNDLDNYIEGNSGNNVISGGAGTDELRGRQGNDTYVLDDLDTIFEVAGEGTDTVRSSISYTLVSNLENLALIGDENIDGFGNELANIITGNDGNNFFDGFGGSDTLIGGLGNDIYRVGSPDTIVENAGEGSDTVRAIFSYTLGANLENLDLTGTGNTNGTGNELDNDITGNNGDNIILGLDGYDRLDGRGGNDTLVGGLGNDSYFVDDPDTIVENADEGIDTVWSSFSYTLGENLEELMLTGAADINGTGNDHANVITGNDADNIILGLGNNDTLLGWGGNDTLVGGQGDDWLDGENGDDTLIGGDGNDRLIGGQGNDTMIGGLGNDIYAVDDPADNVVENAAGGEDWIWSHDVSYTLGDNQENLQIWLGDVDGTGNSGDNTIFGSGGSNVLRGLAGDDYLAGFEDDDTLIGGLGDDTYHIGVFEAEFPDIIIENAGEGTDAVLSEFSYTLGANVENLWLVDVNDDIEDDMNGTGNALDNRIGGNSRNNILTGLGGNDTLNGRGGTDTLVGGLGNDTYELFDLDTIVENAGQGTDTVRSSITYTLAVNVENLVLTGTANINGTGNAGVNTITGNSGNNVLDGGVGNDSLAGGLGNDSYVRNGNDTIVETAGGGTDTVQSGVTYTLINNLENLVLTGAGNINGTGNTANNLLVGNGGNNSLSGLDGDDRLEGGAGNDTLTGGNDNDTLVGGLGLDTLNGGAGFDIFRFDTAPAAGNQDTISGFSIAEDTIRLENAVFVQLTTPGVLSAANFRASTTGNAVDADDLVLYETDTGRLYYDADGSGAGVKVLFATLTGNPAITNVDIEVV